MSPKKTGAPTRRDLICQVLFGEHGHGWLTEAHILMRVRALGDDTITDTSLRNHLAMLRQKGEVEMQHDGDPVGLGAWRVRE